MQIVPQLAPYPFFHIEAQTALVANDKIKRGMLPEETFHFLSSIALRHNGNIESNIALMKVSYCNRPNVPLRKCSNATVIRMRLAR